MKILHQIIFITSLFAANLSAETTKEIKTDQGYFQGNGLYLNVAVIGDWKGVLKEWKNPTVKDTPIIKTKTDFHRGEIVIPFITFSTNGVDAEGKVDVTYDFQVIKPDGSIYIDKKGLIVFKGIPPKGIGMFQQAIGCKFEEDDPFGKYSVRVKVTDNHKEISESFHFTVELLGQNVEPDGGANSDSAPVVPPSAPSE